LNTRQESQLTSSADTQTDKLVISIDSQVLAGIQTCNQQAAYRFIDSIEPRDYGMESLELGLIIHEGLAEHYAHFHNTPANVLRGNVAARMEAYAAAKTSLSRTQVNACIDIYSAYTAKYITDNWVVARDTNNNPLVESTFAKTLYEDDEIHILYTGITDLVLSSPYICPVDHKSWGSYFKPAIMSNQFHGYMWALNSKNLIINRIGVKGNTGKFERIVVTKSPEVIQEWKDDAVRDILRHLDMMHEGKFRRNREACGMYGGCRYITLCSAEPSHRKYLKEANYTVVPIWNPLNRD
jgi:hypothetical protein